jgi:hypothetical protein
MKITIFWVVAPCSLVEVTDVSEVLAASIIIVQTTRRYNPEDSHLLIENSLRGVRSLTFCKVGLIYNAVSYRNLGLLFI